VGHLQGPDPRAARNDRPRLGAPDEPDLKPQVPNLIAPRAPARTVSVMDNLAPFPAVSILRSARTTEQGALLDDVAHALELSDLLNADPAPDCADPTTHADRGALAWECAEAWCQALTAAWLTAHAVLPEDLRDLL